MIGRFAFTAKYWDDSAVVCRAVDGRPGPVVDQEFGQFKTWTQAYEFAVRLNEGLELPVAEVQQIITESILRAEDLLSAVDSAERGGDPLRGPSAGRPIHAQFMLAKLDLAVTFCRLVRSKPSKHSGSMLQNARKAFFDALHNLRHLPLSLHEVDAITRRLQCLQMVFQECLSQHQDPSSPVFEEGRDSGGDRQNGGH